MNEQGMSAVPQALAANLTRLVSPARLQSLATLPGPLAQEPAEDGHMFGRAGSPPGRNRPMRLADTVQQLAIHTQGGVVNGTVTSISNDAIEDEKLGLVYSARIQLEENRIRVGDRDIALSPGMAVRAEVKTDKRRVIDYFLSPLKQHWGESLEER